MKISEEEVEAVIDAERCKRNEQRHDHRNGHYTRTPETTMDQITDLHFPRPRHGHQTQVFERYHRRRDICGWSKYRRRRQGYGNLDRNSSKSLDGPRVFHTVEREYNTWKTCPLAEKYVYAFANGTYFSVIYDEEDRKMLILAVVGISTEVRERCLGLA